MSTLFLTAFEIMQLLSAIVINFGIAFLIVLFDHLEFECEDGAQF